MIRQINNEFPHDLDGEYGDCQRCCFAAILGLERDQVPHFFRRGAELDQSYDEMNAFLAERGLTMAHFVYEGVPLEMVLEVAKGMYPQTPVILGGKSRSGVNHSVVMLNGEIVMDPTNGGIVGPCDDGYYWITLLAVGVPNVGEGENEDQ